MAEARRADAAPRPGQDARAVLHPAAHRPDRAAQHRHLAAVGAAARDPGADHARQPALVDDPLPDHHHPVPDADRAAQQEAADGAARPDPQRRPRGDRAAPAPRAVQGRDRHRRGRHPDHPRLARRCRRPTSCAGVLLARRAAATTPVEARPATGQPAAGASARARRGARPHRLVVAAVRAVQPVAAGRGRRGDRRALPVRRRPAVPQPRQPRAHVGVGGPLRARPGRRWSRWSSAW